jgi:hypothetical protein
MTRNTLSVDTAAPTAMIAAMPDAYQRNTDDEPYPAKIRTVKRVPVRARCPRPDAGPGYAA